MFLRFLIMLYPQCFVAVNYQNILQIVYLYMRVSSLDLPQFMNIQMQKSYCFYSLKYYNLRFFHYRPLDAKFVEKTEQILKIFFLDFVIIRWYRSNIIMKQTIYMKIKRFLNIFSKTLSYKPLTLFALIPQGHLDTVKIKKLIDFPLVLLHLYI